MRSAWPALSACFGKNGTVEMGPVRNVWCVIIAVLRFNNINLSNLFSSLQLMRNKVKVGLSRSQLPFMQVELYVILLRLQSITCLSIKVGRGLKCLLYPLFKKHSIILF